MVITTPAFSGSMGEVNTTPQHPTYAFIGGGYYSGIYQKLDEDFENGTLESMATYDLKTSNGYGQIGIGTQSRIDKFVFDHQLSVLKLGGSNTFTSPRSKN
ncbi:MAG: hypothetical protein P1U61_01075 [Legionellaceae bacterium]|nr:hypothetical protein [Legionellaceae bacterium]